ncbi:MAG TPA: DUF3306 domain-containing protein [Usitatibacter sp.]|nr:DUF3306 domain-containing protein [Usitatibacter sp.]
MSEDNFLSRWSRRKLAERRGEPEPGAAPPPAMPIAATAPGDAPVAAEHPAAAAPALPPLESLTPESDFTPFMHSGVDPGVRGQALKTLFQDPRFNVMDGLDVYIDDYSKPDPLPDGWLEKMTQVARLGEYRDPEEKAQQPAGEDDTKSPPAVADVAEKPALEQRVEAEPEAFVQDPAAVPHSLSDAPSRGTGAAS